MVAAFIDVGLDKTNLNERVKYDEKKLVWTAKQAMKAKDAFDDWLEETVVAGGSIKESV